MMFNMYGVIVTYQDFISDQLGPSLPVRHTAIDDVSLNKSPFLDSQISDPQVGKPSFVANFPKCHNQDWFAQIKLLKIREEMDPNDYEVKWKWFSAARHSMSSDVVRGVYDGLGDAFIFINDLAPFISDNNRIFLELGIDPNNPNAKLLCMQLAEKSLMWRTPLYTIHNFDPCTIFGGCIPVDCGQNIDFNPEDYLKLLGGKAQNVQQFVGETQASFQELVDPDTVKVVVESLLPMRFFSYETVQAKRVLWASAANRTIDKGNEKVEFALKGFRDGFRSKWARELEDRFGTQFNDDYVDYGHTYIDIASHELDELQMADLACGHAEELFRCYDGAVGKLLNHFKRVFYNGKPVR